MCKESGIMVTIHPQPPSKFQYNVISCFPNKSDVEADVNEENVHLFIRMLTSIF